ncbi:MAG: retropepsin-like aspartic protease [Gemmataceae bacterium]
MCRRWIVQGSIFALLVATLTNWWPEHPNTTPPVRIGNIAHDGASCQGRDVRIPLVRHYDQKLFVHATIAGKPCVLLVDTGASGTWLDRNTTGRLDLTWKTVAAPEMPSPADISTTPLPAPIPPVMQDQETDNASLDVLPASLYVPLLPARPVVVSRNGSDDRWDSSIECVVPEIQIGSIKLFNVRANNFNANGWNDAYARRGDQQIDGILGSEILEARQAVIDYATQSLYLRSDESLGIYRVYDRSFELPITSNDERLSSVMCVRLYEWKYGDREWKYVKDFAPSDRSVRHTVNDEGHYWFAAQCVMRDRSLSPPDVHAKMYPFEVAVMPASAKTDQTSFKK